MSDSRKHIWLVAAAAELYVYDLTEAINGSATSILTQKCGALEARLKGRRKLKPMCDCDGKIIPGVRQETMYKEFSTPHVERAFAQRLLLLRFLAMSAGWVDPRDPLNGDPLVVLIAKELEFQPVELVDMMLKRARLKAEKPLKRRRGGKRPGQTSRRKRPGRTPAVGAPDAPGVR